MQAARTDVNTTSPYCLAGSNQPLIDVDQPINASYCAAVSTCTVLPNVVAITAPAATAGPSPPPARSCSTDTRAPPAPATSRATPRLRANAPTTTAAPAAGAP